jgi:hypothetical protein
MLPNDQTKSTVQMWRNFSSEFGDCFQKKEYIPIEYSFIIIFSIWRDLIAKKKKTLLQFDGSTWEAYLS